MRSIRQHPFKAFLAVTVLGVLALTAVIRAQTGTLTFSAPMLTNVTQWGTTAVTAATALTDSNANPTAPSMAALNLFWNASVWQRAQAAALANMPASLTTTSRNATGVGLVEKSSRWGNFSNPAAGSQGTISWAAEAAVRHVADCVSFSASAVAAPAATTLSVQLRDGATGAGTVLQQWVVTVTATTGNLVPPFGLCGLGLVGTTNTALTLEWSASLANLSQAVSLTGYNVN